MNAGVMQVRDIGIVTLLIRAITSLRLSRERRTVGRVHHDPLSSTSHPTALRNCSGTFI